LLIITKIEIFWLNCKMKFSKSEIAALKVQQSDRFYSSG